MAFKVLIVDDDRTIGNLIAEYLTTFGYIAETADNVKLAVSLMQAVRYDIVIMEVNLPDCTGGYCGKYLLNHIHFRYPWIKIIVVTGDTSIETGLEAISLGASYWLTKPFSLDVLINRISILFSLSLDHFRSVGSSVRL